MKNDVLRKDLEKATGVLKKYDSIFSLAKETKSALN